MMYSFICPNCGKFEKIVAYYGTRATVCPQCRGIAPRQWNFDCQIRAKLPLEQQQDNVLGTMKTYDEKRRRLRERGLVQTE